jgi:hypothetical protein
MDDMAAIRKLLSVLRPIVSASLADTGQPGASDVRWPETKTAERELGGAKPTARWRSDKAKNPTRVTEWGFAFACYLFTAYYLA